ncbi:hypothetical protein ACLWA8_30040 [Streptosporangium longisporum]|uniref:Uncharacterized protein n=1 Tax=Streptosporangium longisporum TaxID=46187 RepID=A0ABP6KPP6_9ACTN
MAVKKAPRLLPGLSGGTLLLAAVVAWIVLLTVIILLDPAGSAS